MDQQTPPTPEKRKEAEDITKISRGLWNRDAEAIHSAVEHMLRRMGFPKLYQGATQEEFEEFAAWLLQFQKVMFGLGVGTLFRAMESIFSRMDGPPIDLSKIDFTTKQ